MIRIKSLQGKAGFVLAVAGAAIVGGATTAIVSASIPSSADGKLYGCYRNNASLTDAKGALRLIDNQATPAQNCTAQETAVNWPAASSQEAYTFIKADPNNPSNFVVDSSRTKNVTSMTYAPTQGDIDNPTLFGAFCLTLPFTPKNIQASLESVDYDQTTRYYVGLKDANGVWSAPYGTQGDPNVVCQGEPTANAIVVFTQSTFARPMFLKFEN